MSQRKLLLADDSITIQKVVNLTFADEGIEVITVGDGDSAMEKMAEIAPDLVMADVNMPGLNGYEVCEKIRQSDNLKKTPVILLVGSFEPFDEEKARSVGADDYLTKPFQSIRQLVSKVTNLLSTPRNGETAATSDDFQNATTLNNFSAPDEPVFEPQVSAQFGDTGMDDEMIQTDTGEDFSSGKSSEFEPRTVSEPEYEGKTQPLTAEDLQEFPFSHSSEETTQESFGEQNFNEQKIIAQTETGVQETEASEMTSPFDFSDDNLLEIPFVENEEEELAETEPKAETSAEPEPEMQAAAEENENEPVSEESEKNTVVAYQQTESAVSAQLSPEMIDAIAQKVIEKLSDKAVKDVAWEVVPQMADLIIKKMAEERLKE